MTNWKVCKVKMQRKIRNIQSNALTMLRKFQEQKSTSSKLCETIKTYIRSLSEPLHDGFVVVVSRSLLLSGQNSWCINQGHVSQDWGIGLNSFQSTQKVVSVRTQSVEGEIALRTECCTGDDLVIGTPQKGCKPIRGRFGTHTDSRKVASYQVLDK